jgi:hypothetical protein
MSLSPQLAAGSPGKEAASAVHVGARQRQLPTRTDGDPEGEAYQLAQDEQRRSLERGTQVSILHRFGAELSSCCLLRDVLFAVTAAKRRDATRSDAGPKAAKRRPFLSRRLGRSRRVRCLNGSFTATCLPEASHCDMMTTGRFAEASKSASAACSKPPMPPQPTLCVWMSTSRRSCSGSCANSSPSSRQVRAVRSGHPASLFLTSFRSSYHVLLLARKHV